MKEEHSPVVVSVVRNRAMYGRCLKGNPHLAGCKLVACDNEKENLPIPVHYNRFLNSWDYSCPAWFVFCHEDFDMHENLAKRLGGLDRSFIHGPCGARQRKFFGMIAVCEIAGRIEETDKNFMHGYWVGTARPDGTILDTLDCMCMAVHSTLVEKFHLRFDERMFFDLYAEDFCAAAQASFGVKTRLVNLNCSHHTRRSGFPSSYAESLAILETKYPDRSFCGTCSYIGGNTSMKNLCGPLLWLAKRLGRERTSQTD